MVKKIEKLFSKAVNSALPSIKKGIPILLAGSALITGTASAQIYYPDIFVFNGMDSVLANQYAAILSYQNYVTLGDQIPSGNDYDLVFIPAGNSQTWGNYLPQLYSLILDQGKVYALAKYVPQDEVTRTLFSLAIGSPVNDVVFMYPSGSCLPSAVDVQHEQPVNFPAGVNPFYFGEVVMVDAATDSSLAIKSNDQTIYYIVDAYQLDGVGKVHSLCLLPCLGVMSGINDDPLNLPGIPILSQNHPNPFNSKTTISYDLLNSSKVNLSIYDIQGRRVETLRDGKQKSGHHIVNWDASNYASGIYFYKLETTESNKIKRMSLLK